MGFVVTLSRIVPGVCLLAAIGWGCATNPVTGRPEVSLISTEKEREIGAELAVQIEEAIGLVEDAEYAAYVQAVGKRLGAHSPRRDIEYVFHIIDMADPNAFALPGGYVYVSRGLLALVNSEDELAGVLGHEIAHVAARHAVQRVNVAAATAPVRIAAGITGLATSIVAPGLGRLIAGTGQVASGLVLAPYSREQERAADRIGQDLTARAGWDPKGIATFLETLGRMEALRPEESGQSSFFATHPSTPNRVTQTIRYASELTAAAAPPIAKNRAELLAILDGLLIGNSPAGGVFVENRFLQPSLHFSMVFPDGWKTVNARRFVVGLSPDEDALILLQAVDRGNDPLQAARTVEEKLGAGLLNNAQVMEINGHPAVRSVASMDSSEGRIGIDLTWIGYEGVVYQIVGMTPHVQFNTYRDIFRESAETFRRLSASERAKIQEKRLRIVRAHEGETLDELTARVNGAWTAEETAVANAIQVEVRLRDGQLLKVTVREPYATSPGR